MKSISSLLLQDDIDVKEKFDILYDVGLNLVIILIDLFIIDFLNWNLNIILLMIIIIINIGRK